MLRLCFSLVLCLLALPVHADVSGKVQVIDGDTIWVGDTKIRIHGIDTPERAQTCDWQRASHWSCGDWISDKVAARFGNQIAHCDDRGRSYDRVVARCYVDGVDIGHWLVAQGYAVAYREYALDYVAAEEAAAQVDRGLHSFAFAAPKDYRKAKRAAYVTRASAPAPVGCAIKGNISRNGGTKIYHMPGQRDYSATVITIAKGERWFCSEFEAEQGGWRPAKR